MSEGRLFDGVGPLYSFESGQVPAGGEFGGISVQWGWSVPQGEGHGGRGSGAGVKDARGA